eukprot:jgi/Ulvmu1/3286/UM152_0008.1
MLSATLCAAVLCCGGIVTPAAAAGSDAAVRSFHSVQDKHIAHNTAQDDGRGVQPVRSIYVGPQSELGYVQPAAGNDLEAGSQADLEGIVAEGVVLQEVSSVGGARKLLHGCHRRTGFPVQASSFGHCRSNGRLFNCVRRTSDEGPVLSSRRTERCTAGGGNDGDEGDKGNEGNEGDADDSDGGVGAGDEVGGTANVTISMAETGLQMGANMSGNATEYGAGGVNTTAVVNATEMHGNDTDDRQGAANATGAITGAVVGGDATDSSAGGGNSTAVPAEAGMSGNATDIM